MEDPDHPDARSVYMGPIKLRHLKVGVVNSTADGASNPVMQLPDIQTSTCLEAWLRPSGTIHHIPGWEMIRSGLYIPFDWFLTRIISGRYLMYRLTYPRFRSCLDVVMSFFDKESPISPLPKGKINHMQNLLPDQTTKGEGQIVPDH